MYGRLEGMLALCGRPGAGAGLSALLKSMSNRVREGSSAQCWTIPQRFRGCPRALFKSGGSLANVDGEVYLRAVRSAAVPC